jgi:GNAT superfamily N-acetyltransferase
MMHVRDASEDDAEQACSVIRNSIVELCFRDHHDDAETLGLWLANKTPAHVRSWIHRHHVLVAVDGSCILGVAAMTASGEVILNYVSPGFRFAGVSKALLTALEGRAKELGLALLTLLSTVTAVQFYRSAGYAKAGAPVRGFGVTMGQPMQKFLGDNHPERNS